MSTHGEATRQNLTARESTRNPVLGIAGAGQLAKMTALAAFELGCEVVVLERDRISPAVRLATRALEGDWRDSAELLKLAAEVDVVTLESEFVPAASLAAVEEAGHPLFPGSKCIAQVQDKLVQKRRLAESGLPVPPFRQVNDPSEVAVAAREFGFPLLLKARRMAYDGKGNVTVRAESEIAGAWERLGGNEGNELFVESFCPFVKELAVMITRGRTGEVATYPLVETVQRDHICHLVSAPAAVEPELAARALEVSREAVAAVGGIGTFGVELFLTGDGGVFVNELAPRVHNSGHYTIEACACSQFENHVRAVLGWPLGSTEMVAPAAAMVNLLGTRHGSGRAGGLEKALAVPGAHVHIYGKTKSAPGRKLGHVTALGQTREDAILLAQRAAGAIEFGETD